MGKDERKSQVCADTEAAATTAAACIHVTETGETKKSPAPIAAPDASSLFYSTAASFFSYSLSLAHYAAVFKPIFQAPF